MASIIQRGNAFSIVYRVAGKQRWESFKAESEAESRKLEIEYQQDKGTFVPPNPMLLEDFLAEYVDVYGLTKWGHSTFSNNVALIKNYVNPSIGKWMMKDITTKKMDAYFTALKSRRPFLNLVAQAEGLLPTETSMKSICCYRMLLIARLNGNMSGKIRLHETPALPGRTRFGKYGTPEQQKGQSLFARI